MKYTFTLMLLLFIGVSAFAQDTKFTDASESDPKAKAILDKVKKRYQSYNTMEANFTLDIEFPEQPVERQKGKIKQQGDKFHMSIGTQEILSDGTAIWLIFNNNKEVQINDIPEDEAESIMSPQSLFSFYEKDDFVYVLINEMAEKGRQVSQIEFKPLDRDADYSKLRLTVDRKTAEIVRMKAFGKDGSRYTFQVDKLVPNKAMAASTFTFDQSKYPDYYIEDLRE